jgi:hypothetical protein
MPNMDETWADIPGWPGYQASDTGHIRSTARLSSDGRRLRGRKLKPRPTPSGYLRVSLCIAGKATDQYIHYLVAAIFIGPRPEGLDVAHGDGNPANNAVTNLRYATRSENQLDMRVHGTHYNGRKTHYNGRKTHCIHGHEFTPENTRRNPRNPDWRICKTCERDKLRAWRALNR